MILIIEGADLVGKSTLAARFASDDSLPIVKIRWALRGDPEVETRAMAASTIAILQAARPNVIFDRIYFSWWAYAPVLGYDSSYMPSLIADFAAVQDARLVLLTASAETLRDRFEQNPDLHFPLEVIQGANARFPSLLPLLPASLPSLHLDTSTLSPDAVYGRARAFVYPPMS
jgi:hypothetical protein